MVAAADRLVWLVTTVGDGVRWWSIAEQVGMAVGRAATEPATVAVIAGIELLAGLAIYAFQRVVRDGEQVST